jgi:DNA-binding NtrC family response regulator
VLVARGTEVAARAFGSEAVLGRSDIVDDRMSREHARVHFDRGHWSITDLDSRNGTFVNAERIAGEVHRRGDTVLRCGHSVFLLLADATGHPSEAEIGPELQRAYDRIREIAAADKPLLLACGSEADARVYHAASPRSAGPFVAVRCATLPEGVAERLIFGAKKGVVESIGHFQMASGGTLFLDDVTVLSPSVQTRLVQSLDAGVGIVLGGDAALRLAVGDGRFDALLYKRLAKTLVQIPSLADRRGDIARIVQRELAARGLKPHAKLVEACLVRGWPGNTAELVAAITQAADAAQSDIVRAEDLDPAAGLSPHQLVAETAVERVRRDTPPADIDKPEIEAALARANGVIHIAARLLGVHRTQLYQLMDKHGIVFEVE